LTVHQPKYNLFDRWIETDLLEYTDEYGTGVIVFSPLAQGLLTSKYLDPDKPIPENSRAADPDGFLHADQVTDARVDMVRQLTVLAKERGQTMAQMAIAWTLRDRRVTSALIGARNKEQIIECSAAIRKTSFSQEELTRVDEILAG
jgi:L-glyceraldehyde 3-phosphate reductase